MEKHHPAGNTRQSRFSQDFFVIAGLSILTFVISAYFDLVEMIVAFAQEYEQWQLDEFITVFIVLMLALTLYSSKRRRELNIINRAIEQKNSDLEKAIGEIRQLKGILPICASCKKIRDDRGYWHQVESYVREHTEAEFSHGICPECMRKLYPEFAPK